MAEKTGAYLTDELNRRLDDVTRWYGKALKDCVTIDQVRELEKERYRRTREIAMWYRVEVAAVEEAQREDDEYWQRVEREQQRAAPDSTE